MRKTVQRGKFIPELKSILVFETGIVYSQILVLCVNQQDLPLVGKRMFILYLLIFCHLSNSCIAYSCIQKLLR